MILGVIQARMDSKRLPGKVLLPILGKPILWHIYNRLQFSKKLDEICISTSTNHEDDEIIKFAQTNKIKYFRGNENNVIIRHLGAANNFHADVIVRITADNPLVDPEIIDELISLYENNPELDFLSNNKVHTFPIGLDIEVIPKKTLDKFIPISEDPYFYESFIGKYIYDHPNDFKSKALRLQKPNLLRWTLDYPEDYEFIKEVYSNLYNEKKIFYMRDILKLLDIKPEIKKINTMHYS